MMTDIEERITQMASCGLNPYVIEERLGMEHYTIHIKYHHALMNGYTVAPASGRIHTLSAKEKAARKRERAKEYREEKRDKRKEKKITQPIKPLELPPDPEVLRARKYMKEWRQKNLKKIRKYQRDWKRRKDQAKRLGIELPKRVPMTREERLARRREVEGARRREHIEEYRAYHREYYKNMSPERKRAKFDKSNAARRERERLKKEQANAQKQEAAQGVQAASDMQNGLLLSA